MRVLIVEDSGVRVLQLKELYWAHEVITVDSAESALNILQTSDIDLLHLDYDLADSSKGSSVAKGIPGLKREPLVIIHSENPEGVRRIKGVLPSAYVLSLRDLNDYSANIVELRSLIFDGACRVVDVQRALEGLRR